MSICVYFIDGRSGAFILQEISYCSLYGLRRSRALSSGSGPGRLNTHTDMSRRIPSHICIWLGLNRKYGVDRRCSWDCYGAQSLDPKPSAPDPKPSPPAADPSSRSRLKTVKSFRSSPSQSMDPNESAPLLPRCSNLRDLGSLSCRVIPKACSFLGL